MSQGGAPHGDGAPSAANGQPAEHGLPTDLWGTRRDFYTFSPESLGATLPQFEILAEVGKGSMGIVYEARVRATGKRIALKILPPSLTLTERALARFLREGRIMARIEHPDIVAFYDQGHADRLHWFAMEFVDGTTLQERLQIGPLPIRQACEIAARVGRALHFAHDRGVVHRDVKPGNLMLRNEPAGGVAITDFGLARETGTGSMTDSGAIVGTPIYMAPELVLGGSAQSVATADVYSLGATLYHLLTGHPPFDAPTAQGVLKAVLEHDPVPAQHRRRELPTSVCAVLAKAMHRDAKHRYGSALELAEDLERHLRGERVLARLPNLLERAVEQVRRRPLPAAVAALLMLLAYLGYAWQQDRARGEALRHVSEAERLVAEASGRDDQERPRTGEERRQLLLSAIAEAGLALRHADDVAARYVRARAAIRLRLYDDAVADLDAAERLLGDAGPDLLLLRVDALRQSGGSSQLRRLQQDLTSLLRIDPSAATRALVAEHLLDLADSVHGDGRALLVQSADDVLADAPEDDPRVAVARARVLELQGESSAAVVAIEAARDRFRGDLYVHLQAAALFER
ncbi:MAG: Serine/threonine-protein kinase PrkC, partial [Planctomycetota bacterium]